MSDSSREMSSLSLRNKRIFIVDDNVLNRATYQIMFLVSGAHITFDAWGKDTVRLLQGKPDIDLIILDLMLPMGGSGFELFGLIRQIPGFETTPIIAVSASDPYSAMKKCRQLGFSGYISKPINEELFPEQILRVLQGEQIWAIR